MEEVKKGIENVIALETRICFIDGLIAAPTPSYPYSAAISDLHPEEAAAWWGPG